MKYYLAPLEGITGYTYRNAVHRYFGEGIDKYFTPFFAPHTNRTMNTKEMRDVLPENNQGIYLVPQILTNSASDFLAFECDMSDMFGYEETNINLGCPSGTVVSKGRGAGMLSDTVFLKEFLDEVFSHKKGQVSLKVRLGVKEPEEFYALLDIFNGYELSELIIHPRVREEFYKGKCHEDIFEYAIKNSSNTLCWSGDINSIADRDRLLARFSDSEKLSAIMLGRGMVANPALIRQLSGKGEAMKKVELKAFLGDFTSELSELFGNQVHVLHKLKELWQFMIAALPEETFENIDRDKCKKAIMKAKNMHEYEAAIRVVLSNMQ